MTRRVKINAECHVTGCGVSFTVDKVVTPGPVYCPMCMSLLALTYYLGRCLECRKYVSLEKAEVAEFQKHGTHCDKCFHRITERRARAARDLGAPF